MPKAKQDTQASEMSAKAVLRNVRTSPRKANIVAGLIRGKSVGKALTELSLSKRRISQDIRKLLMSAVANAEHNHNLDIDSLIVKEAYAGKAMTMKRFQARGRGRAGKLLKPFSHITVVLSEEGVVA